MGSSTPTEGPHHHALARFLRIATEQPLASPETALAEAMSKEFFPADVQVQWRTTHRDELAEESTAEWVVPRRGKWSMAPVLEIPTKTWIEASPTGDYRLARTSTAGLEGFKITKRRDGGSQELEITFRLVGSTLPVKRIIDFRQNITGSTVLFQAFMSLKASRLAPSPRTNHDSFLTYLEAAGRDVVRFISYPGTGKLIEQEVETVIHEMFGLGWDVQNLALGEASGALRAFIERVREAKASGSLKLNLLYAVLGAIQDDKPPRLDGLKDDDAMLDAIAHWTYLHARFRRLNSSQLLQDEHAKRSEIREYLFDLPAILHRRLPPRSEPIQTTTLSSWLRLWFCVELWQEIDGASGKIEKIPPPERSRLYCDLTYVVRESLRAMLYGDRAEFRFQPVALAAALRTLVEQHAVWVLGLPQAIELWGILREIGGINLGGGPFYAAGHLQHVLEMYICGAWICAIKIHDPEEPQFNEASIRQILAGGGAWRPAEGKQVEFQRAFGLAVLLHDIGTLLFPFWPRRAENLANIDGAARKRLKAIRSALDQNVEHLLVNCERELIEAGVFDPAKEQKVHEWIDECVEQGQADHSVLGAWYLIRVAKSAPSLQSSVVRQAARAILFHGINTQEIRTDEDPVAALLVLCDELIVWRQGHEPPVSSEVGRYIHSIASELRPEESIFLDLNMHGLKGSLETDQEGKPVKLSFTLDWKANLKDALSDPPAKTWPVLKATLRQPDRLPTPAYKLWLLTSQNLGRIGPLAQIKFGPVLHLTSKIPSRHPTLTIREIFAQVVPRAGLSLRPCLQRWLSRYPPTTHGTEESAICGPAQPFCERRLPPLFPELERLVEAVVHEEILRNQEPPQRATKPG